MAEELVIRNARDVSDFVDKHAGGRSSRLIVMIALGGVFADGYDFTSLGIAVPALQHTFGLSPFEVGSVTAMMAIGAAIGAIWGGKAADRVGRYKMFLIDLILLVVAALGAALSVNLPMLLAFRFLLGLGVGLDFPVALSFIAEFVNRNKRGGSCNLWAPVWSVAASCTGLIILPFYLAGFGENLWRIAVGFGAVPALIVLLLRFKYVKESAPWAAHNVGLDEAARILEATYKIKTRVSPEAGRPAKAAIIQAKFGEIFSPTYIKRTLLISVICITQSMEYFAIGFNLPSISQTLFGKAFINAIMGAVVFNMFGIVGSGLSAVVMRKIGSKRIMMTGYVLTVVALFAIFMLRNTLPVTYMGLLVGLMILAHSFGAGSQAMTTAALSYPTRIRGLGTGWGQGMVRVGSIMGFYFFPLLISSVGFFNMIGVLMIAPAMGLVATLMINWNPVGASMDEVEKLDRVKTVPESI
jgi:MFS family permease